MRDIASAAARLSCIDRRLALFVGLAALQLLAVWRHEPWEDELQALLIARDSHGLTDWYWNFRYEGHPPLWHLVLKLCLAVAEPAGALHLALSLTTLSVLALLVFASPFPLGLAATVGTGYFVSFEYGAIARGYSLGVALLLAVVAFRRSWWVWILIAALPQAGVQGIALSGICAAIVWQENRWSWRGAALWGGGVLLALAWMLPAADFTTPSSVNMQKLTAAAGLGRTLFQSGIALLPVDLAGRLTIWAQLEGAEALVLTLIGILLPLAVVAMARREPVLAALAAVFVAFTYTLSMKVYPLYGRHFGLILVLAVAIVWITTERGHRLSRIALAVFGVQAVAGGAAAGIALATPFTAGRALTDWVRANGYENAAFVPDYPLYGLPATAYLGTPSVDVTGMCRQTFVRWRFGPADLPVGEKLVAAAARAARAADSRALLVMHSELPAGLAAPDGVTIKLVRRFEGYIQNPKVVVYEVAVAGERMPPLPVCPGLPPPSRR